MDCISGLDITGSAGALLTQAYFRSTSTVGTRIICDVFGGPPWVWFGASSLLPLWVGAASLLLHFSHFSRVGNF